MVGEGCGIRKGKSQVRNSAWKKVRKAKRKSSTQHDRLERVDFIQQCDCKKKAWKVISRFAKNRIIPSLCNITCNQTTFDIVNPSDIEQS